MTFLLDFGTKELILEKSLIIYKKQKNWLWCLT
jgi:hypothetical protein